MIKLMTVADGHTILMDVTFSFSNSTATSSPLHASTAESLADLPFNPTSLLRSNASTFEHSGIGIPSPRLARYSRHFPCGHVTNVPPPPLDAAASHLVRSYIRSLPALTPLALVLKQFLSERGLNNTYTGGAVPFSPAAHAHRPHLRSRNSRAVHVKSVLCCVGAWRGCRAFVVLSGADDCGVPANQPGADGDGRAGTVRLGVGE